MMQTQRHIARWGVPALIVLLVAGLAAAPRPRDQAQSPPQAGGIRLAFVNSQMIMQQVPGYAAAESTYNHEMQGYQKEMQKIQQQLDSTVRAYQRAQPGLSQAQRDAKEAELRQQQQQVQQRTAELQQRAQEREQELVSPLEDRAKAVIEGIRAERNLAFIFDVASPGGGIIAADRALDLTAVVIQRLQAPK